MSSFARGARLSLESLETRETPSTGTYNFSVTQGQLPSGTSGVSVTYSEAISTPISMMDSAQVRTPTSGVWQIFLAR